MKRELSDDLDFLKQLDEADRNRFLNMSEKEQEQMIRESMIAKQEERFREHGAGYSQLCDRLSSESFQG